MRSKILLILQFLICFYLPLSIMGQEEQKKSESLFYLNEGIVAFEMAQFEKAGVLLNKYIKQMSWKDTKNEALAYYYLARISIDKKDYKQALFFIEKGLVLAAENKKLLTLYTDLLSWTGQYEMAINLIENMLNDDPHNSELLNTLAKIVAWNKNYEYSLRLYERILKINPKDLVALTGKARVLSWNNNYEEAAKLYQKILKLKDDYIPALSAYANLLSWQKKYAEAEKIFSRLIQLAPRNIDSLNGIARLLSWQGKYYRAKQHYQKSLEIDALNIEALLGMAFVHYMNWNKYKAKSYYQKVLQIQPHHQQALQGLSELSKIRKIMLEYSYFYSWALAKDIKSFQQYLKIGHRIKKNINLFLEPKLIYNYGLDTEDQYEGLQYHLVSSLEVYFAERYLFEFYQKNIWEKGLFSCFFMPGIQAWLRERFALSIYLQGGFDSKGRLDGLIIPGLEFPLFGQSYGEVNFYFHLSEIYRDISAALKLNLWLPKDLEFSVFTSADLEKRYANHFIWSAGANLLYEYKEFLEINLNYTFSRQAYYDKNSFHFSFLYWF